ncbi:hypothetical protein [Thermococcus gammatolerans]|uniref:Uncharacterized protein n=1 Tax=Thermococcus gammatolerans (strain DSM 15229 / JCM 11827 / EJ3) TaxID=593117 RepID=C5A6K3_THEGJ|nr:hypothetical protein [Thermococcus gammatolerans]ACS33865.1 Conserved hypothetical protein [Thermococcus gammatolerans EJ3]
MRKILLGGLLVLLVFVAGCISGPSSGTEEKPSPGETTFSSTTTKTTPSPSETMSPTETTPRQTKTQVPSEDWAYLDLSLIPENEPKYSLHKGSLSDSSVSVEVLLIEGPAKFVKTSANWEASPGESSANNVVFQVNHDVYYFEVGPTGVYYEGGRVVGDLSDFVRFTEDKYLGWENGFVRIYSRSLNKYREKKDVMAYAATLINGEFAIVTSVEDNLTVTTFVNGEASSEEYSFDCPILSMHPAFTGDTISGFYMATTCGVYYVSPNLETYDSGLGDSAWIIISNDHDDLGTIVVYSKDLNEVVGLHYSAEHDEVLHSKPLSVSYRPDAASVSGLYLALARGTKLYLYELGEDGAYNNFGILDFPYPIRDVKINQLSGDQIEVGVAWKEGFAHIVGKPDDFRGEHSLSVGEEISTTGTQTSTPPAQAGLEGIFDIFTIEKVSFGELWGAKIHLEKTPDYRNVHDWLQIRVYEPAGLPEAYFAFGRYMVHVTASFRNFVESKSDFTKYDVTEVYELPSTPKDFTFGIYDTNDIFMAGQDGKLYLIYGGEWKEEPVGNEKVRCWKSKTYVTWDIDADGVNVMSRGGNNYFVGWKDDKIYVITYTNEQFYNAEEEGLPKVQPKEVQLPENIVAVYPLDYGRGFLIRTETGLYLYDVMGYFDYGPDKLYTLLTDAPGMTAVQIYTDDAYIYRDGTFTVVYVTSKYDANDKEVPTVNVVSSKIAIPGVRTFAPMFNTYNTQLAVGFDGKIALYNVTTSYYYDENNNEVYFLNLTLDQSFSVPFTPDYVYGEDECYCHVHKHDNYFYAWAGNDYYVLFGPKNRRW